MLRAPAPRCSPRGRSLDRGRPRGELAGQGEQTLGSVGEVGLPGLEQGPAPQSSPLDGVLQEVIDLSPQGSGQIFTGRYQHSTVAADGGFHALGARPTTGKPAAMASMVVKP